MDQQHEPQNQSDDLPYWPISGRDLVFELTVSEVVMSLAARIPPELFHNILFYITNRVSGGYSPALRREPGILSPNDILTDLRQCSLVCLFWANRCREHMFSGRTLEISSYEEAEIFRQYFARGCSRLTQVHQLIKQINVTQNYSGIFAPQDSERQVSFLHLLHLPTIQDKLKLFVSSGPVPDSFNPAKLDTPHWGIPPSIVVPSSFLRHDVSISFLHLPSFYHVTKYIKHFSCATDIKFHNITWDGQMTLSLPHDSSTIAGHRRSRSLSISAMGCTNTGHLALTALMLNRNCPLHRLSDGEHMWMIKFLTLLWDQEIEPDADVSIKFDVSEHTTTMHLQLFHFVFEEAQNTDRSASTLSMVGMHACIYRASDDLLANFDALVNHVRIQPTIRALQVILLFKSIKRLQKYMKPVVKVLALAAETIQLVLAYEDRWENRAVGVDLVTLEPNGHIWTDLPTSTLNLYDANSYLNSLHILQRQLEKKPRGSLH